MNKRFDVIIIGGGLAGIHGANIAHNLGKKVAIVNGGLFGGHAVHSTDLPLNYLAEISAKYQTTLEASKFGINTTATSFNYTKIHNAFTQIIKNTSQTLFKDQNNRSIEIIQGKAYFLTPNSISVNNQHYQADKFLIATGSDWNIPKIPGLENEAFLTPTTFLNLSQLPKSIFLIGGHPIAITLAQILATFRVRVYLTTKNTHLLPDFSSSFNRFLERFLTSKLGIVVSTNSQTLEISHNHLVKHILFSHAGIERRLQADEIIIAESTSPNLDLGLINACVNTTTQGILTNKNLQTSNKNIFAAGDVLGNHQTTTSAIIEAETAIFNMFKARKRHVNYAKIPVSVAGLINTSRVGLTEKVCQEQSLDYKTDYVDFSELPRSIIQPSSGFLQITTDKYGKIIGTEAFGPESESIIQQLAFAIDKNLTAKDLITIPQTFLSWQEAINIAVNKLSSK